MNTCLTKERPILFSAPMVRALLHGEKTQTRRVAKLNDSGRVARGGKQWHVDDPNAAQGCPYGAVGEFLWVRERHARIPGIMGMHDVHYFADGPVPTVSERHDAGLLRSYPSIHMPRWACRIMLDITGISIERLQDISEAECWLEGAEEVMNDFDDESQYSFSQENNMCVHDAKPLYGQLWESINGKGAWAANPLVWVIKFRVIEL